jgi:hypothetical protein
LCEAVYYFIVYSLCNVRYSTVEQNDVLSVSGYNDEVQRIVQNSISVDSVRWLKQDWIEHVLNLLGLTGNVSENWKKFLSDTIKEAAATMKINYPVQDEEVEVEEEEDASDSMDEWEVVDDENIGEIIKYV